MAAELYPQTVFWGEKHAAALAPLLEQADVFVLPGSGGLAVQEAMAHGLPVIVAAGDGTQVDLVTPANGWLIPQDQLDSLVDALKQAESRRGQLRAMGQASHRLVESTANIEIMADVFISVMESGRLAGE
jgi:glycosyltransferase involved in cell wall biosynthesis